MKIRSMSVAQACRILSVLEFGNDSIYYRGALATPTSIYINGQVDSRKRAWRVHIEYFDRAALGFIRGTLQSMVADRLRP